MPSASAISARFGHPAELGGQALLDLLSSLRASVRTERGAQSAARTASRIAPRMRCAAKRSNGTPRLAS